jgi:enamine deaminase RidA (YjgF/YER057c/UK114 family)
VFKSQCGVRKEFYGATVPAATWVQVDRLFESEYVVEVELTAAYPKPGR